jgi:hypothetical protein
VRDAVVELRASEGKVWLSRLAEYLADAAMEAEQAPPVHQGPMITEKRQRDQEAARARLADRDTAQSHHGQQAEEMRA